jgi:hypothetical protein
MKKLIAAALVVAGVIAYINAKSNERSRIYGAVEEYTYKICGSDSRCRNRVDKAFRSCFQLSYVSSPIPGTSWVDVELYVECLNEAGFMPIFEVVKTDSTLPFPAQ